MPTGFRLAWLVLTDEHGPAEPCRVRKPGKGNEMETINTICAYCGTGCGMALTVRDGSIVGIQGDPGHPVNQGELCLKGYYGYKHVADGRRLTTPLIDRDRLALERHGEQGTRPTCSFRFGSATTSR